MLSVFEMQEAKFRTSHLTQHYYGNNATLIVGRVEGKKKNVRNSHPGRPI
jgi:hypothetical protein